MLANIRFKLLLLLFSLIYILPANTQVNAVVFGKNRIQYKKFDWHFYQSENFNVYYNEGGLELAKYIVQVAEEELNGIEDAMEYPLSKRADIIIYNHYDDYKSSNIGLGIDWQNSGGITRLVNNKMALYFDGNHNTLHTRLKEGIARILMENILFGDDIGEFASNQALLDLPTWLTDGYVSYIGEHWSAAKDEELKNAILSGNYKNFNQLAFEQPVLAGHSFWYYIARKYKEKNVTYFLYLSRIYKNLNSASERICKKKFNDVLVDFMNEEGERYLNDIKQRRNAPKGRLSVIEDLYRSDFYHFAANPNPKNNAYGVVEFTRGKYRVKFLDNVYDEKTLLEYGARTRQGDINPNTPILAWDGKGSRLLCIYNLQGKTYMFVYDMIAGIKRFKQEITGFDQILDAGYLTDANTLVLSAVKNGHSDIFTYRIDNGKTTAITNDVYDDLDPTFVTFPGRYGIIFSSNRPNSKALDADTAIPSRNRFNIFLADFDNKDYRQVTQLTNMKYGEARYPMQYSVNHFTFVSDENGIGNRWAGFFTTQTGGLDTLFVIGDDLLRNPDKATLDSTLDAWQKSAPDSIAYFKTYEDSTYTFPITNYQSSLLESRVAGNNDQVSEVRREGDLKFLYKLKVDSVASKAFHETGLKEILSSILKDSVKEIVSGENTNETTCVFADLYKDKLTVSISLAGNSLYKRGYRGTLSASAPLREDYASCLLLKSMQFAKKINAEFMPDDYFFVQMRYDQLEQAKKEDKMTLDHTEKKFGTVGAVARDVHGHLAAGTSTGGMTNKKYGRIGDTPIIGSGTYANNNTCAISCTGHGELFIRAVAAYDVSCLMEYKHLNLHDAMHFVVQDKLVKIGGEGGMIGVDAKGNIAMLFNSAGMYRAAKDNSDYEVVAIYDK